MVRDLEVGEMPFDFCVKKTPMKVDDLQYKKNTIVNLPWHYWLESDF